MAIQKWPAMAQAKWKSPNGTGVQSHLLAVIYIYICINIWLVVGTCFIFSYIWNFSPSQLTKSIIFQRGRSTTNQICMVSFRSPEVGNPSQGTNRCASASRIERGLAHAGDSHCYQSQLGSLILGVCFKLFLSGDTSSSLETQNGLDHGTHVE